MADVAYLLGVTIGSFVLLTLFGMLFMKLILKIGFKQYEIGWKDAFRLSLYTFGIVMAIGFILSLTLFDMGVATSASLFGILMIVGTIFTAKNFLTKIGMEDKIWLFSSIWVIGTFIIVMIMSTAG